MLTHALLAAMPVPRALVSLRAEHASKFLQAITAKHDADWRVIDALQQAADRIHIGQPTDATKAAVEVERIEAICVLLFDASTQWRMVDTAGHPIGPWTHTMPDAESLRAASTDRGVLVNVTQRVVA